MTNTRNGIGTGWKIVMGAVVVAWVIVALWVVPQIIRSAYAGTSLEVLNNVIGGRDQHPVERYLGAWRRMALILTVLGVVLAVAARVAWRHRDRIIAWADREIFDPTAPRSAAVRLRPVAVMAAFGLLAGALESLVVTARFWLPWSFPWAYSLDAGWMAPLGGALFFAACGLPFVLVSLVIGRAWRLRALVIAGGSLMWYGLLSYAVPGFQDGATILLALGLAVTFARMAVRPSTRPGVFLKRWGTVAVAIALFTTVSLRAARWTAASRPGPAQGGPNIVLLILDTVRAQSMGLYGFPGPTTPSIDSLASDALVFDRAIAPASWTLATHASMFSGRWPHELGIRWHTPVGKDYPVLAEVLGEHGWSTGGFVANHYYGAEYFGLNRGFQTYTVHPVSAAMVVNNSWYLRRLVTKVRTRMGLKNEFERKPAPRVNSEFLAWLDGRRARDPERPFFAFLNYIDAHAPYYPPAEFRARLGATGLYSWSEPEASEYTKAELDQLVHSYRAGIAYIDHSIGALIGELKERGLWDETILIVTADHGESLGELGVLGHSYSLSPATVRVPLVIHYPRYFARGERVATPVSLRDLPATLMALTGIEDHPFPGSVLPRDSMDRGSYVGDVRAELEPKEDDWSVPEGFPAKESPLRAVMKGDMLYVRSGKGDETFFRIGSDSSVLLSARDLDPGTLSRLRPPGSRTGSK